MKKLAVVVVLAACHPAKVPAESAVVENAAPSRLAFGYVVVAKDAWLGSAASASAPGAQLPRGEAGDLEHVWVARLVADEGEWIEIENLTWEETAAHCYGTIAPLTPYKLRLHVRKADVQPVTRHEVDLSFDDGSGARIAAGVVVVPSGDRVRVLVDGVYPELTLDALDLGRSYLSPSAHLDAFLDRDALTTVPPGDFMLDGRAVDLPGNWVDQAIVEEGPDANHQQVTITMPCSEYRGIVEKVPGGTGISWGEGGLGTLEGRATDLPEVRANAALTWPDGSFAGETIEQVQMVWPVSHDGDRYCFPVPVMDRDDRPADATGKEDWFLHVCVQDADWIPGFGG